MLPRSRSALDAPRAILLAALSAVVLAAAACGSSTSTSVANPTTPTPTRCQVTVAGSPASFPAAGGNGTVQVTTDRDCTWSAASDASWITLSNGTSGQGNGTFPFSVAANTAVAARSANISVNGQNFAVSQQAAPCSFTVSPTALSAPSGGTTANVSVQAQSGCAWTAASSVPWVTITGGASGNGNGTVQLAVGVNTGAARSGTVTVAGQAVTVNQGAPAASCSFSISPTSASMPAAGGNGTATVTTAAGCAWTATSPVAWVTISSGGTGTGPGAVRFNVDANTGAARSATLSIAGSTFTVNQAAADAPPSCSFSVAPTSQSFGKGGGKGSVSVKTGPSCSWTATSGASWVTITSGAPDTGNGSVKYSVDANSGAARSTTLIVAGQTVTIDQAAAGDPPPPASCSYSISPNNNVTVPAAGGNVTVAVSTTSGCDWTAAVSDSWMTIASGGSGSGPGAVVVDVSVNTGGRRNGYIAAAGDQLTVHQDAASKSEDAPTDFSLVATQVALYKDL